jgi:hypothetical protein
MRVLLLVTLICFFLAGCEKTIKDVRTNDAKPALASSR